MKHSKKRRFIAAIMVMIMTMSSMVFAPVSVAAQLGSEPTENYVIGSTTFDIPFVLTEGEIQTMKVASAFTGYEQWGYCHWGLCPVINFAIATRNGAYISWWSCRPAPHGYRVFRSLSPDDPGISITDFPIPSGTSFIFDANASNLPGFTPGASVYYRVVAVLEEARLEFDENEDPVLVPEVLTDIWRWVEFDVVPHDRTRGAIVMEIGQPNIQVNDGSPRPPIGRGSPRTVPIDAPPIIEAGRTMLPVRAVVEEKDGTMGWDGDERRVDMTALGFNRQEDNEVSMWLGEVEARVNGATEIMDVPPLIVDGRTLLPVRFAAEFLGSEIEWIGSLQKIIIVYPLRDA